MQNSHGNIQKGIQENVERGRRPAQALGCQGGGGMRMYIVRYMYFIFYTVSNNILTFFYTYLWVDLLRYSEFSKCKGSEFKN